LLMLLSLMSLSLVAGGWCWLGLAGWIDDRR
jgi:hypothetical protein